MRRWCPDRGKSMDGSASIAPLKIDYRSVEASYLQTTYHVAGIGFPMRYVVPFLVPVFILVTWIFF